MTRSGKTVQINISIPKKLNDLIRSQAAKEDRSLSNWCARALMAAAISERKMRREIDNDRNNS